jgi:hypothetical protein
MLAACEDKHEIEQKRSVPNPVKKNKNMVPTIDELQKGNYRLRIMNYPVGDRTMPPGHIEGAIIDDKGNPVLHYLNESGQKCEAFINKSEKKSDYNTMNRRFRNKHHLEEAFDTKRHRNNAYRRSVELKLSQEDMEHWLLQSANEDHINYHIKNNNCADGVCRGLNISAKSKGFGNTAYPNIVYDIILKDPRVIRGSRRGKGTGILSTKFNDPKEIVKEVDKILKEIPLKNILQ